MPDMVCIKRNGVSYCWDFQTKKIEVFTKEPIDANECPVDVLYELLTLVSERVTTEK